MPVFEKLNQEHLRPAPKVWIRKIDLFRSLEPASRIRDTIKLRTGVNIVWGIEDDTDGSHFEPGHGVGKTTLCRLIRYCLNEPSFGQQHAVKEIQHTFPNGYIAADIVIDNQQWSVLRPFDKRKASCAKMGVSIDALIADRPKQASYAEFTDALSATCLADMRTDSVLPNGGSIELGHLIALCARDQEARYQSYWQWRSHRSDAGSPKIQRDDAFLILRSVLNLLPEEETKLQARLIKIAETLATTETEIEDRKREPQFWSRHYRKKLLDEFEIESAMNATLDENDLFGLPKLVGDRIKTMQGEQIERVKEINALERRISLASASLLEPAELQEQEEVVEKTTKKGTDTLLENIAELREIELSIKDAELAICRYGDVLIGECSIVVERLSKVRDEIRDAQKSTLPKATKRDEAAAKLRQRTERRATLLKDLREKLDALNDQKRVLDDERRETDTRIEDLEESLQKLKYWEDVLAGVVADSDLAKLLKRHRRLETEQETKSEELTELLKGQDKRLKQLREFYEALIRSALSQDFKGSVRLNREGIDFRIFRGENLSGEAFETLSILIADLAVLLMGSVNSAAHPGLLIHDSPREADLGGNIYRRLLLTMAEVADEFKVESSSPFQYIVTTTTPPPTKLKRKSFTRLQLGGEHGPLFNEQLHRDSDEEQSEIKFEE
jgi:hypothetical protein